MRLKNQKPALLDKDERTLRLADQSMADLLHSIISRGDSVRFKAKGTSMHPFIQDGDIIIISPSSAMVLKRGHIVAYLHPAGGKLMVHRILRRKSAGLIIRGDNLPYADGLIPYDNILGIVTSVERNGKKVRFGNGPEKKLIALLWHSQYVRNSIELAKKIIRLKRKLLQL